MSFPATWTFTTGKRSQRSMGISSLPEGSCAKTVAASIPQVRQNRTLASPLMCKLEIMEAHPAVLACLRFIPSSHTCGLRIRDRTVGRSRRPNDVRVRRNSPEAQYHRTSEATKALPHRPRLLEILEHFRRLAAQRPLPKNSRTALARERKTVLPHQSLFTDYWRKQAVP